MPEPRSRIEAFHPQDWPALWALTHGPTGIGGLCSAKQGDVVKMLLPREIRGGIGLRPDNLALLDIPVDGRGCFNFDVQFGESDEYELCLEAYVEPSTADCPQMLEVNDYVASLPTQGGTQAFYRNLLYQLGHMDIPSIYGQNTPMALGYFMHRVGQVPVGLLDPKFEYIRRRIAELKPGSHDAMKSFSQFSWTVGMYGETFETLLDPRYRDVMAQLEQQFNAWSQAEREVNYKPAVIAAFRLTDQ